MSTFCNSIHKRKIKLQNVKYKVLCIIILVCRILKYTFTKSKVKI